MHTKILEWREKVSCNRSLFSVERVEADEVVVPVVGRLVELADEVLQLFTHFDVFSSPGTCTI